MDDERSEFIILTASPEHAYFAQHISAEMEQSANERGTGIGKRSPETLINYMKEGNAIIAFHKSGQWAGFCFIGVYDHGAFVSNSGLIVAREFRAHGLARELKISILNLCSMKYPAATVVGITTSLPVMKINTELGFYPTTFAEMPKDEKFWKGCELCVNHDILKRTGRKLCLCTAMRHDPVKKTGENNVAGKNVPEPIQVGVGV